MSELVISLRSWVARAGAMAVLVRSRRDRWLTSLEQIGDRRVECVLITGNHHVADVWPVQVCPPTRCRSIFEVACASSTLVVESDLIRNSHRCPFQWVITIAVTRRRCKQTLKRRNRPSDLTRFGERLG